MDIASSNGHNELSFGGGEIGNNFR